MDYYGQAEGDVVVANINGERYEDNYEDGFLYCFGCCCCFFYYDGKDDCD